MIFKYIILAFFILCSSCNNAQKTKVSKSNFSVRDSVLVYKINGLREFIKNADYWGYDTESYWAYDKAIAILDSIVDYSNYEECLARIYSATSYVYYGLSYLPSVIEESRQHVEGEDDSFPKVGVEESTKIIIRDYTIPEQDSLYNLTRLEKEFMKLALWHDSLIDDESIYLDMTDDEFHEIELTAAYTQYILYKHISENFGELKEKM